MSQETNVKAVNVESLREGGAESALRNPTRTLQGPVTAEELASIGRRTSAHEGMTTFPGGVGRPLIGFSEGVGVGQSHPGARIEVTVYARGTEHSCWLDADQARHIAALLNTYADRQG